MLAAITAFYEEVMQHLAAFQRKAPVRKAPEIAQVDEPPEERKARVWVASADAVAPPTEFHQDL